jgi:hypothetical protein
LRLAPHCSLQRFFAPKTDRVRERTFMKRTALRYTRELAMTESRLEARPHHTTAIDKTFITDVALIASMWCLGSIVVNPAGDFPLIDDWSFGRAVRHLLESGDYRPEWASMPLITNVLWGALFCLPEGFNFTTLRLSTLLASLLALAGSYVLVRDLQQPRWLAFVITLSLGFNPIYYALSHTFMTDVPFTALAIWTSVFFARSLRSGSNFEALMGTALALAATLSRQLALCIPLAFAVTLFLRGGATRRTVLHGVIPLTVCAAALFAFDHWLAATGRVPIDYHAKTNELLQVLKEPRPFTRHLLGNAFDALIYLGLFLLPFLVLSFKGLLRSDTKRGAVLLGLGVLGTALGAAVRTHWGDRMLVPSPHLNILLSSGIGPVYSRDTFILHLDHIPAFPAGFWMIVAAMGLIGAVLLITRLGSHVLDVMPKLLRRGLTDDSEAIGVFLTLCGIIYLLPLLAVTFLFDRYLIPLIPFLATGMVGLSWKTAAFSRRSDKSLRITAFALLAAFALFAIGVTRDYLAWNRVRWEALQDLIHPAHVQAGDIDGGFEFNCLYLFDPAYRPDPDRSWWCVHADTYQIAFGAVPGYAVMKQYTYHHWLPPHVQEIVVLRRE